MNLKDLIYTTPNLVELVNSNDLSGVVAYVNAKNIVKTNSTLQTIWGFGDKYGDVAMGALLTVLESVGSQDIRIKAALLAYQTRGLDLSNDKIQTQIDTIIQAVPSAEQVLTLLKLEGKWMISLADTHFNADITLEQVETAIASRVLDELEGWVYTQTENIIAGIRQGTVTNQADAISMFGG